MNKININVPRLNANDDDVEVIDIYVNNGEKIKKGQKLFTFETTKTAIDFHSDYNGIINKISIKKGNQTEIKMDTNNMPPEFMLLKRKAQHFMILSFPVLLLFTGCERNQNNQTNPQTENMNI